MDNFIKQALTISVAQICDNIGWHSITDTSMNIMTDILHHYISDLSITSKKYAEHAYSDVPDIQDIEKAFRQKSVSLNELRRYIKSTGPVKFPHNLPVLNIRGNDVLNALKPGSREIVTRPIHIHEHLPTLCTEPIQEEQSMETEQVQTNIIGIEQEPEEVILHKRLREISSVVMTSGGFLSPSREGRLAESKLLPFPEIKKDIPPPESSKSSVILPAKKEESSHKITPNKKKIKSKKLNFSLKKKQTGKKPKLSKNHLQVIEPKPEVLKKIKKLKEDKIFISKEPVMDEIIDVVNITEKIEVSKIVVPMPHTNKVKIEEVLPKFSFFGPLPLSHSPGLISPTLPQISNIPEKVEKPTSPIVNVEVNVEKEDINRKEQKKKKKEKKKEKKEKKKLKDRVKEKKKEKLKCGNKVPKLKFRFGARIDPTTKVLPVEKPLEVKNITIVPEPEPMEIDLKIESDISIDVLQDINSPPKVPIQKIKTKITTKIVQPSIISPEDETPPPPAFYFDNAGNQVWICPICTKPDDGSPMIGCDGCDVWYHWVCVGIQCPPDCAVWYCPKCMEKRVQNTKGKRGRPRKSKC